MFKTRTGIGFDVHQLNTGYPLILGGILIPHGRGLVGHSDADVLTHAIIDAILGAANMGDIGQQFPDTDPQYKGISSLELLSLVVAMVEDKFATQGTPQTTNCSDEQGIVGVDNGIVAQAPHQVISYIDAQIMAQEPKVAPYVSKIVGSLAHCMHLSEQDVSIKATTTERLGFVGRGEGIAAMAVCTLSVPTT